MIILLFIFTLTFTGCVKKDKIVTDNSYYTKREINEYAKSHNIIEAIEKWCPNNKSYNTSVFNKEYNCDIFAQYILDAEHQGTQKIQDIYTKDLSGSPKTWKNIITTLAKNEISDTNKNFSKSDRSMRFFKIGHEYYIALIVYADNIENNTQERLLIGTDITEYFNIQSNINKSNADTLKKINSLSHEKQREIFQYFFSAFYPYSPLYKQHTLSIKKLKFHSFKNLETNKYEAMAVATLNSSYLLPVTLRLVLQLFNDGTPRDFSIFLVD